MDRVHDLRLLIGRHRDVLEAASPKAPFLDMALVGRLHDRLLCILDQWATYDEDSRSRVTATVLYVVDNDDEEHDVHSPIGLVDDEEQVTALEEYLTSRGYGQEA